MVFTIICVMCMANANIHAVLFAWAFCACLMVNAGDCDVYGTQIYIYTDLFARVFVKCSILLPVAVHAYGKCTHTHMLLYLPERTLNVRYWFIVIVRL